MQIHVLIPVSRRESVRIASILPLCAFPFSIDFGILYYVCVSQEEQSFVIYLSLCQRTYIDIRSAIHLLPIHVHIKFIGFTLSSLQATTRASNLLTFPFTLHFLVYSSAFSLFVPAILRVFLISPRSHPQTSMPTPCLLLP